MNNTDHPRVAISNRMHTFLIRLRRSCSSLAIAIGVCSPVFATTYNVGPGQSYTALGSVPWYKLAAGDVVNIYPNGGCYAEKFLISTQGTSWQSAVTIQGITDAQGRIPCITGLNAVQSSTSHDRWSGAANAQYSESLYVIGISLQTSATNGPQYVVLNNLEITGAAQGQYYTADDGSRQPYADGVAGVRIVNGNHIAIQNCYIHGISGNGIFGKPNGSFPGTMADIQLSYNHIGANGVSGNYLYHNSYLEADQATYVGNLFEPLVSGGPGADLKDRSAGTIVAYNRFNGPAARFIDLVEPQDGWSAFGSRPYYGSDFVYGNVFEASATATNFSQMGTMIHYGGDQGSSQYYRNKTLSFYDNTLVVTANSSDAYKMAIFQPELSSAIVALSNNILLFTPRTSGATPELDLAANNNGSPVGSFNFGANWISPGWQICFGGGSCLSGSVSGKQNVLSPANNNPGFTSLSGANYTLAPGSSAVGVASALPSLIKSNPQGGNYTPALQYVPDQKTTTRASLSDIGAFAAISGGSCTYQLNASSLAFSSSASTTQVSLAAGSACNWSASTSASWLTVNPTGGTGNSTLGVSVQANVSTQSRTATVTVQSQQIAVTQAGASPQCTYSLSPTNISALSSGYTGPIAMTAPSGCTWTASSSASWAVLQTTSGIGSSTIGLTVQANASTVTRSATVTSQSQQVVISQAGVGTSPGKLAVDVVAYGDQASPSNTVQTSTFSTHGANELLLAFVSTDYISGTNTSVTGVSSPGATWQLVKRANGQSGTSEIWRAFAASPLSNVSVTASLTQYVASSMTVMSFTGVDTSGTYGSGAIGAVSSASAPSGNPGVSLTTTRNNSWVLGVGNDFDNSLSRSPVSGQVIEHQYFPPVGDTYWVQMLMAPTPGSGTIVKMSDTSPSSDRYNVAVCEILSAP